MNSDILIVALEPFSIMVFSVIIEFAINLALYPMFKHMSCFIASKPMRIILCMVPLCTVIDFIFILSSLISYNPHLLIIPFTLNTIFAITYSIIFIYNIFYAYINKIWDDSLINGDDWE